jgi:S1-C subfamily serine protease
MTAIHEASELVGRLAAEVGPAVVGIGPGWRGGSGVVIAPGRVLTAAHNLRGDGAGVVFADGRRERASVVAADRDLDLAFLAVETGDAPVVETASDAALAIGTPVVAIARPGGRALRATLGFVASDQRLIRGPRGRRVPAIEHTAPLPRGSSGGPLLDADGRLLGLNLIRLEGGLIVAVDTVALAGEIVRLGQGEASERRRLGIAVAPPHVARRLRRAVGLSERSGILVRAVESGSPAATAGIERGDLLVAAAGRELEHVDDLYAALDDPAASTLDLTVVRGDDERSVTVEFDAQAAA